MEDGKPSSAPCCAISMLSQMKPWNLFAWKLCAREKPFARLTPHENDDGVNYVYDFLITKNKIFWLPAFLISVFKSFPKNFSPPIGVKENKIWKKNLTKCRQARASRRVWRVDWKADDVSDDVFFTQSSSAVLYIKLRATLICLFFISLPRLLPRSNARTKKPFRPGCAKFLRQAKGKTFQLISNLDPSTASRLFAT